MPSISFFDRLTTRKEIASYPPTTSTLSATPIFAQKIHPNINALLEHYSSLGVANTFTSSPETRRHTFDGTIPAVSLGLENISSARKTSEQVLQTQASHLTFGTGDEPEEDRHSPVRSPSFLHFDNLLASDDEKTASTKPSTPSSTRSSRRRTTKYQSQRSRPESSHKEDNSTPNTFGKPSPRENLPRINMSEFGVIGRSEWFEDITPPPLPPLNHPAFAERKTASLGIKNTQQIPDKKPRQRNDTENNAPLQSTPSKRHRKLSHLSPFSFSRRGNTPVKRETRGISRARSATFVQPASRLTLIAATPTRASQYLDPNFSIRRERKSRNAKPVVDDAGVTESKSSNSIRRLSAEWSARQASKELGGSDNWQAQVAREMLFLSGISTPGNNPSHGTHVPESTSTPHKRHSTAQDRLWVDSVSLRGNQGKVKTAIDKDMFHKSADHRRARPRDSLPDAFTSVTPEQTPSSIPQALETSESPSPPSPSALPSPSPTEPNTSSILKTPSKGKRKADDIEDGTPPDKRKEASRSTKSTSFAAEPIIIDRDRRESSGAPSSYRSKRARLSAPNPIPETTPTPSSKTGSTPSRHGVHQPVPSTSKAVSTRSATHNVPIQHPRSSTPSKGSLSHASMPISALISPHAPSVSHSSTFHMKDPRKPAKRPATTGWSLRFAEDGEPGSPIHAWLFFFAFVLFPLWWVASFWRIPRTRRMGDEEKVAIDDPQVEYDARCWRFRCRIMSVVSIFTYIPFIILVAIFA